MCELFGASARQPRDYARWLTSFRQRGGATADNPDGWGWPGGAAARRASKRCRNDPAALDGWLARLEERTTEIAVLGKFNFLLSDGSVLIAHGHDRLHHALRPDGVALVATEPLDDGDWQAFAPGELHVYRGGKLLASHRVPLADDARRQTV